MRSFLLGVASNLLAAFIIVVAAYFLSTFVYGRSRHRLLKLFGLEYGDNTLKVYISRIHVQESIGVGGVRHKYEGDTADVLEYRGQCSYQNFYQATASSTLRVHGSGELGSCVIVRSLSAIPGSPWRFVPPRGASPTIQSKSVTSSPSLQTGRYKLWPPARAALLLSLGWQYPHQRRDLPGNLRVSAVRNQRVAGVHVVGGFRKCTRLRLSSVRLQPTGWAEVSSAYISNPADTATSVQVNCPRAQGSSKVAPSTAARTRRTVGLTSSLSN